MVTTCSALESSSCARITSSAPTGFGASAFLPRGLRGFFTFGPSTSNSAGMTGAGSAGASTSAALRGAARNFGLPSARPQPPGFCREEGLDFPAGLVLPAGLGLAADLAGAAGFALAAGLALAAGFALAAGLALSQALPLLRACPWGQLPSWWRGGVLLGADFLVAAFLAAVFLAGAFSGLVLGSGYVSAWTASDMPSGWNNESEAKAFDRAIQGLPRAIGAGWPALDCHAAITVLDDAQPRDAGSPRRA